MFTRVYSVEDCGRSDDSEVDPRIAPARGSGGWLRLATWTVLWLGGVGVSSRCVEWDERGWFEVRGVARGTGGRCSWVLTRNLMMER